MPRRVMIKGWRNLTVISENISTDRARILVTKEMQAFAFANVLWHAALQLQCRRAAVLPCSDAVVLPPCHAAVLPCCRAAVRLCCPTTMLHAAMLPRCRATMLPCCRMAASGAVCLTPVVRQAPLPQS